MASNLTGLFIQDTYTSLVTIDSNTLYTGGGTELSIISNTGLTLTINDLLIGDGRYVGSASDPDAIQIEADGDVVFSQGINVAQPSIFQSAITLGDAVQLKFGDLPGDMALYHDGNDSFIANTTGDLKIATLTSGVDIRIGHSTSDVYIGDNLLIVGTIKLGSTVLGTTFVELNHLSGITSSNAAILKALNQYLSVESVPVFAGLTIGASPGTGLASINLNPGASRADLHLSVRNTNGAVTPGAYFHDNGESKIVTFVSQAGTEVANISDEGNYSGLAATATLAASATIAAVATAVTATANNSANESNYITFIDGATGTQGIETDTGLRYNPNTGLLSTATITTTGNVIVGGNLTVSGTTTTVDTANTTITDSLLELNSGASSNANDSGFIIERGSTGDNALFIWDESADEFAIGTTTATADSTGNITFDYANLRAENIGIGTSAPEARLHIKEIGGHSIPALKIEAEGTAAIIVNDASTSNEGTIFEVTDEGFAYSQNEQYWSTTGRLVVQNNISNYFGPNNQGVNYYFWNRDLGTDPLAISAKTQTLNSGFKLPYKAVITGYHLNIQGRSTNDNIAFTLVYSDGMYDGDVTSVSQTLVAAEPEQTVTITSANNFYVLDRRDKFVRPVDAMTMIYPRFRKTVASGGTNYDFQLAVQYKIVK